MDLITEGSYKLSKIFFLLGFFYMILCWIYVCYKFLAMKAKSFIVRKIVGKIFLLRHQFILFCICSSACMLHQVLVILEAGKKLCIFLGAYIIWVYECRPWNKSIFNEVLSVCCCCCCYCCLFVCFLTEKSAGCFLIQNNNYLFVFYFFFS